MCSSLHSAGFSHRFVLIIYVDTNSYMPYKNGAQMDFCIYNPSSVYNWECKSFVCWSRNYREAPL